MIASILYFVAVVMVTMTLLWRFIPGFSRQKKIGYMASILNKSESERLQMKQSPLIRNLANQVEKREWLLFLFGSQLKNKYEMLGRKTSFSFYMTQTLLHALLAGGIGILRYLTDPQDMFLVASLLLFILVFIWRRRKITEDFSKRQNALITDLPNLISKMISALEIARPLTDVFRQVAKGDNKLLSALLKKLIANTEQMPLSDALQIFARDVHLPVIYDFVVVVNIVIERGFDEAEKELNSIKNDLRELRALSLREQTKGNPGKMNIFYVILLLPAAVFSILCCMNIINLLTASL
ncbi:type II secretion system F family protein [Paenibacillus polymyxa]|uniref:type II secretion system F family protein n=1 Tax=Paenibacillus polymyxa TaxID=1406 RepID=UPI0025B69EF6|nr:hypothetical protein [Paenibacillus polymyxa]MDN4090912.1 hypothetical protein [Paenibacillus polymyxa]